MVDQINGMMNGRTAVNVDMNESFDAAVADIRRLQAETALQPGTEPPDVVAPFAQSNHDLMLESVDHVVNDWVMQLKRVRTNAEDLEQLVLTRAAKLKADLTQLFLLGSAVAIEAKRGSEVNRKITMEIEKLAEEPQQ